MPEHGLASAYGDFMIAVPLADMGESVVPSGAVPADVAIAYRPKRRYRVSMPEHTDVLVSTVKKALYTGNVGDGKIFVFDVENVIKVRTGEEGYAALQDE